MTLNIELLDRTLNYIIEHPEEHNQSAWRCGTTACYAGWACTLDGAVPVDPEPFKPRWMTDWRSFGIGATPSRDTFLRNWRPPYDGQGPAELAADTLEPNMDAKIIPPGLTAAEKREIAAYAQEILGLDSRSADILFAATNTLGDLQGMVQVLKNDGTLEGSEYDYEDDDEDNYDDEDSCDECHSCSCCCTCGDEDTEDED